MYDFYTPYIVNDSYYLQILKYIYQIQYTITYACVVFSNGMLVFKGLDILGAHEFMHALGFPTVRQYARVERLRLDLFDTSYSCIIEMMIQSLTQKRLDSLT